MIHLVISQEINDLLSHAEFESPTDQNESAGLFHEEKVTVGKDAANLAAKQLANVESGVSAKSKNSTTSAKGDRSSQEKSGKGLVPNRVANNASEIEDYRSMILPQRQTNEPALEPGEAEANFLDDAFGENTQFEQYLEQAQALMKREEQRMAT